MRRAGRAASADRMMAVSQHQANTGFSIAVYTTMYFHMTIHINKSRWGRSERVVKIVSEN